jgi:nanoRNase/pAp phosphatase (c-di-AMP/oligoRNAs hydrolase)
VGLDYLTLDRSARTLSGGETQRIRLATQIGSQIAGVLYVLDEPSIGLHQSDNIKLIDSLKNLRNLGNTVVVVEHDRETMERLGAKEEQTDGIINYPKSIEGVEVGLLFREIEADKIKVGFRSKGQVDVNQVAGQFNGGGHPRAAGAIIMGNLQEIEAKVVDAVIKAFPS